MGTPLFGVDISGLVAQHIGPGLHDASVTRVTRGSRTSGSLTGGRSSASEGFTGIKGIWADLPKTPPAGVEFELNDRIAMLIGDTIPAGGMPKRNDAITINGLTLYVVQLIATDPASAQFQFLCRDRRGPDGE